MYDNGQGVPQDYAMAVKWSRKAADQGYAPAQYALGYMYQNALQDYVRAHMWYNLAGAYWPRETGDKDRDMVAKLMARWPRKNAAKNRDMVAKLMTPAQIAEAQRLAREWRPRRQSGVAPDN